MDYNISLKQIHILEILPFVEKVFKQGIDRPFGYLMFDLQQQTPDHHVSLFKKKRTHAEDIVSC